MISLETSGTRTTKVILIEEIKIIKIAMVAAEEKERELERKY